MSAETQTDSKSTNTSRQHLLNWISLIGLYGFVIGLCASAFLFLIDMQMANTNMYLAIVLFTVMPGALIASLFLIVLGILLERRRRRVTGATAPQIQLSKGRHQRYLFIGAMLGLVFLTMSLYGSYRSYSWTESREFCGEVCHEVMNPEFQAHKHSPHAKVDCVQCHIGPGPEHFVASKVRGVEQMVIMAKGDWNKPIPTPLQHLRPAREICEQCHWPKKFFESVLREHVYYLSDEKNTRFNTAMLIHVGGGTEEKMGASGTASGIHWHMALNNTVTYAASDDRKQNIVWIKAVNKSGKETVYRVSGDDTPQKELLAGKEIQTMDCIDCHNRAVHQFNNPQRALNSSMLLKRIDPSIPYIKKMGLEVLGKEYKSQDEARAQIGVALRQYYEKEYPDFVKKNGPMLEAAIAEMQSIYTQNIFPSMKADWKAHPDNIGHMFARGCFRCHDGNHVTADGKVLTKDCSTCHDIVAQGFGDKVPPITGPQEYKHPEDIMEMWKDTLCTDCHTGAGANSD